VSGTTTGHRDKADGWKGQSTGERERRSGIWSLGRGYSRGPRSARRFGEEERPPFPTATGRIGAAVATESGRLGIKARVPSGGASAPQEDSQDTIRLPARRETPGASDPAEWPTSGAGPRRQTHRLAGPSRQGPKLVTDGALGS